MTFKPGCEEDFLRIFHSTKHKIRNFPGCTRLELWSDYAEPNIYITYSWWEDDKALEAYRQSKLFKTVWSQTKKLFDAGPVAFSSQLIAEVKPE